MRFAIFVMLIIGCVVQEIHGCSCAFNHPQNQFCNAEFVIRAKALSVRQLQTVIEKPVLNSSISLITDFDRTIYAVKVIESFKVYVNVTKNFVSLKGRFEEGEIVDLFTTSSSASCGIQLNTKDKLQYLLTGYRRDGKYRINNCLWNSLWKYLDKCKKQRLGSKYIGHNLSTSSYDLYRNNCKVRSCKVMFCSLQTENECENNMDTCTFNSKDVMRNSICVRSGKGFYGKKKPCQWRKCLSHP
ncbi:hypothetical protein KUTeg_005648 [Tegillarca granosa]|uniref:NTR domain-containing protein n=1 Tax=Tegillarca granosa TaxID=220873 RepID=A0ABQ9FKC3_TEGGR|nr:hypothetical protein KUTeg_005648 [Tegillarca granosa]